MGHFFWSLFYSVFLCFTIISAETQTFIVGVQNDLKPSTFSTVERWYKSTLQSLDSDSLQTGENNKDFLHVYKTVFHGFSAILTTKQAQELKTRPGVIGVLPDHIRQIQTTRTPLFLGLEGKNSTGIIKESDSGSDVIIGVLDTGIWPERRSFHDEDLGPIPRRWKGECVEGEKFTKEHCNRKIIGARYFTAGYEAIFGNIAKEKDLKSARDTIGHGSHTASTAAGRKVSNASLFGFAHGESAGVAPKARLAVYKICWSDGCSDADILAGFDKAVEDGVDVISLSVGGSPIPYQFDPIAIGSYGAMERGIMVSASAGNGGPFISSVTNIAPWITTVGASTIDRNFPADLKLKNGEIITGASLYAGHDLPYLPIIYAGNASLKPDPFSTYQAGACTPNFFNITMLRGKIVMCNRAGGSRAIKGEIVKNAGGAGVIVANVEPYGEGVIADAHVIPGLSISKSASHKVHAYINSAQNPRASLAFRGTQVGVKPAPIVASFSSRGPSAVSLSVIKPDIIAPGVNILAAWSDDAAPTDIPTDMRRTKFNIISGTSMSCPHVSGLMALLKGSHPDWTPAMARSALMTTAYTQDRDGNPLLDEQTYGVSTIWDIGAGHVNPVKAVDPGLVYDLTSNDYLNFLCASNVTDKDVRLIARKSLSCKGTQHKPWNLNYPAISFGFEESGASKYDVVLRRRATHVSDRASNYTVKITRPKGVIVTVDPPMMNFKRKGEKQIYEVRLRGTKKEILDGSIVTEVGKLTWSDGNHEVNTPITVVHFEQPNGV